MRIKVNCSQFEIEVLDRNDKSVYHAKCENYSVDGDVRGLVKDMFSLGMEIKSMVEDANAD